MTHTPQQPRIDLQEVANRNRTARELLAGIQAGSPSQVWQSVRTALADIPALSTEVARLRADLVAARLDRANLAAAALATITAHREGEPDPLSYLRDELTAQGFNPRGRR